MVTRRRVLGAGLTTIAAVSGTAAALGPVFTAGGGAGGRAGGEAGGEAGGAPSPLFDEVYRGRRIQAYGSAAGSRVAILVDGRPLRVMRRVDGSWISVANHFQPFTTPLATARGAVDAIGRARLSAGAAANGGHDHT